MTAIIAMLLLAPPPTPPSMPMLRVTVCQPDGGDCQGQSSGGSPSGGLTDAQLRASAVPVSIASVPSHAVTGPVTDAQLRATAVPVSLASVPSHAVTGTFWQATQPVSVAAAVMTQEGSATRWSCFRNAITATTECQANPGAGQRLYVTSIACSNGAATVQGVDVVYGTGTNCATGITALTHKLQMGTNALTTSPFLVAQQFLTPLVPPQAVAICVRPTAATAFGCTLTGYTAP